MKVKKECRTCRFWTQIGQRMLTGLCQNSKSPRFNQNPLYDSGCVNWGKEIKTPARPLQDERGRRGKMITDFPIQEIGVK